MKFLYKSNGAYCVYNKWDFNNHLRKIFKKDQPMIPLFKERNQCLCYKVIIHNLQIKLYRVQIYNLKDFKSKTYFSNNVNT